MAGWPIHETDKRSWKETNRKPCFPLSLFYFATFSGSMLYPINCIEECKQWVQTQPLPWQPVCLAVLAVWAAIDSFWSHKLLFAVVFQWPVKKGLGQCVDKCLFWVRKLPGIIPPSLLALFSNPGTSDALACSLLRREVWLDCWGHAHTDVTIPLPCGGISEADTAWPASGTCLHPQPAQEALTFLALAGGQSKGQVWRKHSAPSLLQNLFWGLLSRQDFGWVLAMLKPQCNNFLGSLSHTWDLCEHGFLKCGIYLGRNFCFLCLIVP